ncbi:MAG: hypothetical protein KF691_02950 [Phycisphaeraceae bacterium]|nr:hypothetical protein [Phycisphaeraceae bacterium]
MHPTFQSCIRVARFALLLFASNFARAAPPAPRAIAWVLEMHDGFDHEQQASELKSQLAAARAGGARIVCVEFAGNSWRLDVAQQIGDVLATSEPPAIAFVKAESGRAPLAFLVAGCRAPAGCFVQTGTLFFSEESGNARELADAKAIKAAESQWKKLGGSSAFVPYEVLRAAMLDPSIGCRMIPALGEGGKFEMRAGASPGDEENAVVLSEPGAKALNLSAQNAIALGLCSAEATDSRDAIEVALQKTGGAKPEMRERRAVGPSLASLRDLADASLDRAEREMDRAEPFLKVKHDSQQIAPNQKHEAASLAKPALDAADAAVRDAEEIVRINPEVLRMPGPGQSNTGQRVSQFQARWRSKIQQAKDRLEKLRAKAEKLAAA